jgi:hypothetical protein
MTEGLARLVVAVGWRKYGVTARGRVLSVHAVPLSRIDVAATPHRLYSMPAARPLLQPCSFVPSEMSQTIRAESRALGMPRLILAGLTALVVGCDPAPPDIAHPVPELTVSRDLNLLGTPEAPFDRVDWVYATQDGRILVLSSGIAAVELFSPQGEHLVTVGSVGRGPGELARPTGLSIVGDTIWVLDPGNGRLSGYLLDGSHVADLRFSPIRVVDEAGAATALPSGLLPNGSLLAIESVGAPAIATGSASVMRWFEVDRQFAVRHTIASIDVRGMMFSVTASGADGSRTRYLRQPFFGPPTIAFFPNEAAVLRLDLDSEHPRLIKESFDSSAELAITLPRRRRTVDARQVDEAVTRLADRVARGFEGAIARGALERLIRDEVRVPASLSPITGLIAGLDGSMWISAKSGGSETVWTGWSPAGAVIGEARVPTSVKVMQATSHAFWGVEVGDYDVPAVVRFSLAR